jgi:hypothetical protein
MEYEIYRRNKFPSDLFLKEIKTIFIQTITHEFELLGNKKLVHRR